MVKYGKTKYIIILSLCFFSCMLTGCATIFSNPKGQEEVVSIISNVNEIYSEEIKYNGEEWTKENPLFIIGGIASYDEIDNQLRNTYKEKKEEGLIP